MYDGEAASCDGFQDIRVLRHQLSHRLVVDFVHVLGTNALTV